MAHEPAPATTDGRGPVVIVDDDVSCLAAVEQIVRHWGYDTVTFRSFEDARAYLARATPAIVIVDVRLGTYNGLQLVHFSREHSPATQWLVVSGFDDPVLRKEATKLGARFLTKPLDLTQLQAHLEGNGGPLPAAD
ncbi:MAG: response regulator [Acidobacteria bacterium]|nr:response regulator [Acidobacteriota bacterium]